MVIVFPNARVGSLEEIKRRFVSEIGKWRAASWKSIVTLTMPKFKVKRTFNC